MNRTIDVTTRFLSCCWSAMWSLLVAAVFATIATTQANAQQGNRAGATAKDSALALHVLNRLTFGPRPGDVGRVLQVGINNWMEAQLRADTALDARALAALGDCRIFTQPIAVATAALVGPERFPMTRPDGSTMMVSVLAGGVGTARRDSARKIADPSGALYLANGQFHACRLMRMESSEAQLLEVMTDFWSNHFSISSGPAPERSMVLAYDREVIRSNAMGNFRKLLGAVAHSPMMLDYLDNAVNSSDSTHASLIPWRKPNLPISNNPPVITRPGLNENYARELLELHTLGVDGGFTEADVIDVARALTGWSHSAAIPGGDERARLSMLTSSILQGGGPIAFIFDSSRHDADAKVVLGHALAPRRAMEDGEDVLDILARHPSTARFIARKLVVRFVSDTPPEELVRAAADTFLRTDGDVSAVLRTIFLSPQFRAPAVFGVKVKTPIELVLSMRRALDAPPDTAAELVDFLVDLQQVPLTRLAPDGWPETGDAWMNVGAMTTRIDIATRVATNSIPSIPLEKWQHWDALAAEQFDKQVDGVARYLFNGQISSQTRTVLRAQRPAASAMSDVIGRQAKLRELVLFFLSSPEFQHR